MPPGFIAEDGPHPEFALIYGAVDRLETPWPLKRRDQYRLRTSTNIRMADATLLLVWGDRGYYSPGTQAALKVIDRPGQELARVIIDLELMYHPPDRIARWIEKGYTKLGRAIVLNVAGNRESSAPGIGAEAERYLTEVFRQVALRV